MSESNNNIPMKITQLPEATSYTKGMFYPVASATGGTEKISTDKLSLADQKIVSETVGNNLFNKNNVVQGFIADNTGTISTASSYGGYSTSEFIEIEKNEKYTCAVADGSSVSYGNRVAFLFYDASKAPISASYINSTAQADHTQTAPNNAKYVRVSVLTEYLNGAILEKGTSISGYEPYEVNYQLKDYYGLTETMKEEVSDVASESASETISEIAHYETGKNLVDPNKLTIGGLQSDGSLSTVSVWAIYSTSDYIEVEEGEYTFSAFESGSASRARYIALFYNSSKEPISDSYINNGDAFNITLNITSGVSFVRVCTQSQFDFQLEKGSGSSYEPYKLIGKFDNRFVLTTSMKAEVENMISGSGDLSVSIANNSITIDSTFANKTLSRVLQYGTRQNETFEFVKTYLDGTEIKDCYDDITPLRVKINNTQDWTIGANHGWFCFSVNIGSLTSADLGSEWTDGENSYILAKVDSSKAYFIPNVTLENHSFNFSYTVPTVNLTHVSGATHTSEIDVSSASGTQLYPSVNNRTVIYYANDKVVTSGSFECDKFTVVESYNIINYAALGTYLKEHIGTEINDSIEGCINVSISYCFNKKGCLITTTIEALKDVYFSNCGFIQATPLSVSGTDKRYLYVNNQNSNSVMPSASLFDATSNTTQKSFYNSNFINNDVATNRIVELIKDNSNNTKYGFTHGYIPDVSNSADSIRKSNVYQGEFRASTLKSYPCGIYQASANQGEVKTYCCYRYWIEPSDLTNFTIVEANNAKYVIIDAHTQQTNRKIALSIEDTGKTIEVVESYNFTLNNNVVGAEGINFSTSNAYGCAILKIV